VTKILLLSGFIVSMGLLSDSVALAQETDKGQLNLSMGGFNVSRSDTTAMAQVEYVFTYEKYGFRPVVGLFATEDSAAYLYGGVNYEFKINERWYFTPSLSVGYYNQGADFDLDYDVEFYSQFRLDYQLDKNIRIGLAAGHISNADLGDTNEGAETAYLNYQVAF